MNLHEAWRVLWSRPGSRAGVLILSLLIIIALLAPPFLPNPRAMPDLGKVSLQKPGPGHWLGTDRDNRDVLSRVVNGARISLTVAAGAVALSVTLGTLVGMLAGYAGGWVDTVLMRLVDAALAVPRLFLLLIMVAIMERIPLAVLVLVLGATGWFGTSRLVRAEVQRLRSLDFVHAAEALGASRRRIAFRHLLPNVAGPLAAATTLAVGDVILLEAGLSFLGLGVQPPTPSWGGMILEAQPYLITAPWTSLAPGIAVLVTVLAVNLIGEALHEAYAHAHP
ncbi:MAG TPA: ABC transporter permease [Gemmatimonadales bacterium]|nr:ABC transporter permease [Gemmatimonadales bacterium]